MEEVEGMPTGGKRKRSSTLASRQKKQKRRREKRRKKSSFPRDLKLYFPSTCVNFEGMSYDYDNEHPMEITYPPRLGMNSFQIVKGKKLEGGVVSLLSNGTERNYLVRNNGDEELLDSCIAGKYLLICCFKVPLPDNLEAAHYCRAMIAAYSHLRKNGENFEMVMVAKMAPGTMMAVGGDEAAAFNRFFKAFPCLAIPYEDTESRDFLCKCLDLTHSNNHCAAIVLDPDQVVLQTDGSCFFKYGAFGFPYTDECLKALDAECMETRQKLDFLSNNGRLAGPVSLEDFLGSSIRLLKFKGSGRVSASYLTKKKCVVLYLCMDGSLMQKLKDIQIRERSNCEILVIPIPFLWDTASFVSTVRLALSTKKLSSWWVMTTLDDEEATLVGDERATRKLWRLFDQSPVDRLLVVADGGEAVELNGELLAKEFPGFEYPFTRMSLATDLFKRLRSVTLESLLPHPCINNDGGSVPVSQLNGSKVLLYFDQCPIACTRNGDDYKMLLRHYNETVKDWDVVYVSPYCTCSMSYVQHPWLVCPVFGRDEDESITQKLFPDVHHNYYPALVAFGDDGAVLSRQAFRHLRGGSLFTDTLFQEIVDGMKEWVRHSPTLFASSI